ncbi:DUF5522 domain-containing protein [Flavihumibacter petaseus]|uniref:Uncharacterized protein n=1 Tax=Flavihumibacter petaseus NBRC 106054 TaxID=1220578 RepID=A0A0E9MWQ2_9BACT|nr:DUF5522 domain-containing protein [Flavihumibacter petaseus]GAO42177.1 hypothetical protein FPE01S_01_11900 [Flavihumibacter petaseus NBRC 106054]
MKTLEEGIDFYFNERGLMVLTAKYHLERGACCGNGCLHCPYDYIQVAEPRRSVLLDQRLRHANQKDDTGEAGR